MKYKTTGTTAGHKFFVRKRSTAFDKFDKTDVPSGKFGSFTDHKEMKTWEYAAFQKEQFKAIKKRKRRFYILVFISILIALVLIIVMPFLIDLWNSLGESSFLWDK